MTDAQNPAVSSAPDPTILIIDDDPDNLAMMTAFLEERHYRILVAEDGESGLKRALYARPNLILLDVLMPGIDGYETCRRLKAMEGTKDIPVIFMTALAQTEHKIKGFEAGAVDYISKPFQREEVLARVSVHLLIRELTNNLRDEKELLEKRVEERTAELARANAVLQIEIAERERAQEAERKSEKRYRHVFEESRDAVFVTDRNGLLLEANQSALELFGYTQEELLAGFNVGIVFAKLEDRDTFRQEIERKSCVRDYELKLITRDGIEMDCLLTACIRQAEDGAILGYQGILRDITEQKRAEEKIIEQNEFLKNVLESLTYPFYVLDVNDYTVKMANSAAAPHGLPPGMTCYALTHRMPEPCNTTHHFCPLQMIKETKKPFTVEHVHYDPAGIPRNVEVHAYPIFNKQGEVVQMIEYSIDITERKRMEEALRNNAEKIKLFAYSVSHDLKSPAIGVCGLTKLLCRQYEHLLDEKGKKYCEQIVKASMQMVALVEEINVFIKTKEAPFNFETVKPGEILQMVKEEFGALLSMRGIGWSEPAHIPEIRADRLAILRVFRNLVDNALKYGGDELSAIRVGHKESADLHIFSIEDDGVGISQEDSKKIFELFERKATSAGVEGTGLGLAIVKEIAEKHRGTVWVEPNLDKGATFFLSISKGL